MWISVRHSYYYYLFSNNTFYSFFFSVALNWSIYLKVKLNIIDICSVFLLWIWWEYWQHFVISLANINNCSNLFVLQQSKTCDAIKAHLPKRWEAENQRVLCHLLTSHETKVSKCSWDWRKTEKQKKKSDRTGWRWKDVMGWGLRGRVYRDEKKTNSDETFLDEWRNGQIKGEHIRRIKYIKCVAETRKWGEEATLTRLAKSHCWLTFSFSLNAFVCKSLTFFV